MTDKQKVFIAEYLINGFNATQAAITAGYSEKTAYSIGNENLKKPDIREAIKKHVDSTLDVKKDVLKMKVVDKFASVAFNEDEETREQDKLKANEALARIMGMFTDKTETTLKTVDGEGKEIGFNFVEAPKKNDPDTEEA